MNYDLEKLILEGKLRAYKQIYFWLIFFYNYNLGK